MIWNRVACLIESVDDVLDRCLLVVKLDRYRMQVHVDGNGLYLSNLLDGRTGFRGGASSDDSRCL